eukprot:TCONS_00052747-protein
MAEIEENVALSQHGYPPPPSSQPPPGPASNLNNPAYEDSIFIPLENHGNAPATKNSFSNDLFIKDEDQEANKVNPPPPSSNPPTFNNNAHESVSQRHSAPPSMPPPVFSSPTKTPTPTETPPKNTENESEESSDDNDDNDNDDVTYYNESSFEDSNTKKKKSLHGILKHRSSVRDPNAQQKSVTFGAMPKRREDPNPCMLLTLFVTFIIAMIGFILVLMVIRGSIETKCDCDSKTISCPVGWSAGPTGTCYGVVSRDSQTYQDARLSCADHGAYLVSLETNDESDWFYKNILKPRKELNVNFKEIFLGIKPNSYKYEWESNIRFYSWKKYIPSYRNSSCFAIAGENWIRANCTIAHDFYCEKYKYV